MIIPVDPWPGNAIAHRPRGKSGRFRSGKTGKGRDGPLIVDHVQYDWRPVNTGKGAGRMEISFCSRSLATPCRGNSGIPLGSACRSEEHTSELQSLMRISYAVFCLKK